MKTILFIGRFQPLHSGHLEALKQALAKGDRVIVAIGSSQAANKRKNPFTFAERKKMVEIAFKYLKADKSRFQVIALPDFFNDKLWAKHVLKLKFDEVFSGSTWVRRCLKGKKPVSSPKMFNRLELRATLIRSRMRLKKNWVHLVPSKIASYLNRIGAQQRVRGLY